MWNRARADWITVLGACRGTFQRLSGPVLNACLLLRLQFLLLIQRHASVGNCVSDLCNQTIDSRRFLLVAKGNWSPLLLLLPVASSRNQRTRCAQTFPRIFVFDRKAASLVRLTPDRSAASALSSLSRSLGEVRKESAVQSGRFETRRNGRRNFTCGAV